MDNIDNLISKLSQDAKAVKPAHHPVLLSLEWITFIVFYLAVSLMISSIRPDLMVKFQHPWFIAEIVALVAVFITTSFSAAFLSFPDIYQKRFIVLAPIISFALFALVMFLAWRADSPPSPAPVHSIECTLNITLMAILPAALVFYVMRKFASTHHYWSGSTILISAFSIGALWLRLYEQTNSISHLITCHYLPMIGIGLIGMWMGKVFLKW